MLILLNLVALVLIGLVAWWLSGYDSQLTHENQKADRIRRGIRSGVTLLLLEIIYLAPPTAIFLIVILAVIWAGCISELASHGFHRLIDPSDKRVFDPARNLRELDAVAALIRNGKKAEAIQLCNVLKEAGEVDPIALELTLAHLGVPQADAKRISPLTTASQLRRQGKFPEAELLLNSLLAENPRNVDAAMMLVWLYAQDLRRPGQAEEVLRALERQPHIPASHIEFARRSIGEWSRPSSKRVAAVAPPESLDELLARGFFGTAIEILENKTREQPQDFDLRMKLAEVHALHCGNFQRAEKIIQQLQADPNFSPEQLQSAKAALREWRENKPARAA
jgi:hypothetical protein